MVNKTAFYQFLETGRQDYSHSRKFINEGSNVKIVSIFFL